MFNIDAECSLYYNNSKKIETNNTGIEVSGKTKSTEFEINGNAWYRGANSNYGGLYNATDGTYFYSGDQQNFELCFNSGQSAGGIRIRDGYEGHACGYFEANSSANEIGIKTRSYEWGVKCTSDGATDLYHDGSLRFSTSNTGATVNGTLTVNSTNTSSFSGNITQLVASGQSTFVVGSGNAGGAYIVLDGDSNGDSSGSDYSWIGHNTSGDLEIAVDNPAGNGSIYLKSNGHSYQAISCWASGAVELRYQNTKKFETTSTGVTVAGTGAILVPSGTTAQRPSASNGMMRYNSTTGAIEGYAGGAWQVVAGAKGTQTNPYTSVADAQSDNAAEGLHWFKNSSNQTQELYYDSADSGWILVASNHAAYSTIPSGNNRRSLSYTLHRNGTLGALGTANPSQDYIIGDWYSNFSFSRCRGIGYGRNSTSHSYTWTNKGGWVNAQWNTSSRNTITHTNNVSWTSSGGWSKHSQSTYWSIDGIWSDYNNNNSWNANSNQTTVGCVGVAQSHGSPEGGCYYGHGNSEGNYEGWYDSGGSNMDSSGYTTWLR